MTLNFINVPAPHVVAFELTRKCRFECVHCRASATKKHADELTTEQCKRIFDSIAKLSKCTLILTGGEPMERADIYELTSYGTELGLKMVMATCGYSLDTTALEKLQRCGLQMFSFSLDGANSQTHDKFRNVQGAFDIAIASAKLASAHGMKFQINTTITRSNFSQIEAISRLAVELGASCFNPFILVPTGRGSAIENELLDSTQYEKVLETLSAMKAANAISMRLTCGPQFVRLDQKSNLDAKPQGGCLGGRGFVFISYRGDVQTCGFLDISAGNLVENDFNLADIWNNSTFLNSIRDTGLLKGKCNSCEFAQSCRGCRARAFAITGDYMASDSICGYKPQNRPLMQNTLQRDICDNLQKGVAPIRRPFAQISKLMGIDEQTVLNNIKQMLECGLIRRIRPVINCRALGKTAALVTAIVPKHKLPQVIKAINALDGVSHNYLRDNIYNLWFTLQADSQPDIQNTLRNISDSFGVTFFDLPATRFFKLNVTFTQQPIDNHNTTFQNNAPVKLNEEEKLVLNLIQRDIEPVSEPFGFLSELNFPVDHAFEIMSDLINKNVIRRIAAIVDHRKLGFVANTMFVANVDDSVIEKVGVAASELPMVTHCYERNIFPGWPYNFFAMMHSANRGTIESTVKDFTAAWSITDFQLLDTVKELKKQPVIFYIR